VNGLRSRECEGASDSRVKPEFSADAPLLRSFSFSPASALIVIHHRLAGADVTPAALRFRAPESRVLLADAQ